MKYSSIVWIGGLILLLIGCSGSSDSDPPETSNVVELDEYETVISYEEEKLANPQILRFHDNSSHLFVYDATEKRIIEFDKNFEIVNRYGREGRGPGEFLIVTNVFLTDEYLYVVDRMQYRISRFSLNGELDATFNYGEGDPQALPPPAPIPMEPRARDINNQPAVTGQGEILRSNFHPDTDFNSLYTLIDWDGNHKEDIGEIPEGSAFSLDYDEYGASIDEGEIPAYYRSYAFPVASQANKEEIFLVYSAFPKIMKFDTSGNKQWEREVSEPPELDSLTEDFYEHSEKSLSKGLPTRIGLDKYVSGKAGPDGHLYLAMGKNYFTNPSNRLWIHEFDNQGKMVGRYKLKSEDANLPSIFTIDFEGGRIFVPTEEAEIRAYSF